MVKQFISLLILALLGKPIIGHAQDIQFTGQAKQVVAVGEAFTVVYSVNGQGRDFQGHGFPGFNVLSGPNASSSSSISMTKGRTTMSVTNTFTYLLQAQKEGTFEIPPASVSVDGKRYSSNKISIKVVKGSAGQAGGQQGTGGRGGGKGDAEIGANDVFVKAYASNSSPLQGEGTVVTYKIFTRVPIAQIEIRKLSSFSGFWSQNLMKENDKLQQTRQVVDGVEYNVAEIRKIALFPLKSGALTIDPLELTCVAQVRRQTRTRTGDPFFDDFFNDAFFNTGIANVEKNLKSNPLTINVRSLPNEGRPDGFSGAVGTFTFKSEIDKTRLKTNEAVTLKLSITGKGNIQLIEKLDVAFPPDFEAYDPKVSSNVQTTAGGVSGSQIFEYLLIPRKPGKFTIKPITFSYYDLDKRKYITLTSEPFNLDVEKGAGESVSVSSYTGANKEDIKYIGSDIRHIREGVIDLNKSGNRFFMSGIFWILLIFPLVSFTVFYFLWQKMATRRSNAVLMKNMRATRTARKRLQKAELYQKAGKQDEFYEAISQAIWGYLSDKFGIPLSELSIDSVHDTLVRKNADEALVNEFIETLQNTEFARFAPGEKSVNMEKIYNQAMDAITKMERGVK